jgi:hypothetical protein
VACLTFWWKLFKLLTTFYRNFIDDVFADATDLQEEEEIFEHENFFSREASRESFSFFHPHSSHEEKRRLLS